MVNSATAASVTADLSKSQGSKQKLAEDLNQFMNLLVTQLQHQDPLDPMDPNEFTTQLVQFASVEQQIQGNANLEDMLKLQQTSLLGTVVGYIGKVVEVSGNQLPLENGSSSAHYEIESKADSTTITVTDSTGKSVFSTTGETDAGRHEFNWNGMDSLNFQLPDGIYTITVSALDGTDDAINVAHTVTGTVTGVSNDDGSAVLSLGDADYAVEKVLAVRDKVI